jgi:phosphoribosylformylglycinamidine synthase
MSFQNENDLIYLVGKVTDDIACSEYLYSYHQCKASPAPYFDLDEEYSMQEQVRTLIQKGLIRSAHDVSDGGLFVCLAESAMAGNKGFQLAIPASVRKDAFLFGEGQGRVVVTVRPEQQEAFEDAFKDTVVPCQYLGSVAGDAIQIDDEIWMGLEVANSLYSATLASFLS